MFLYLLYSKNYTYETVARVRRDFLDLMWEGIEYKLKVPGFEWEKTIGTEDVGASMGLIIRNILDIKLSTYTVLLPNRLYTE